YGPSDARFLRGRRPFPRSRRRLDPHKQPARNSPTRRSCVLAREFAPADIAAVKPVGEIDLIDSAVRPGARIGERVACAGDSKDPATLRYQPAVGESRAGVKHRHALDLLSGFDGSDH